jgi:hypothetical protein
MHIHLGGHLSYYHPAKQSWFEHPLDAPLPLNRILEQLGIPQDEIALFILNDEISDLENPLITNDDTLHIYPPSQGG